MKAKEICLRLNLSYQPYGKYINKLLSSLRSNQKLGLDLKAHTYHKRIFESKIPRKELLNQLGTDEFYSGFGWRTSKNSNKMLCFRNKRGSVHWYKSGLVRLYLKGVVKKSKSKELFCRAFNWITVEKCEKYLKTMHEVSRHCTFDIGISIPIFEINNYKSSHGIKIYSDKSHPTSIEVEETPPFWVSNLVNEFNAKIKDLEDCLSLKGEKTRCNLLLTTKKRDKKIKGVFVAIDVNRERG